MKRIISIILVAMSLSACAERETELKVYVRDQDGVPVPDAEVTFSFDRPDVNTPKHIVVMTDTNGFAMATDEAYTRTFIIIDKDGYYQTVHEQDDYDFGEKKWLRTCNATLKEIKNPIPMYVKKVWFKIPDGKMPIGFDLEKADWVAPYGTGVHPDFLFSAEGKYVEWTNHYVNGSITFSNPDDGVQLYRVDVDRNGHTIGSKYLWPYLAPEEGYESKFSSRIYMSNTERILPVDDGSINYFFRIRSKRDPETGRLISAQYGKILGNIAVNINADGLVMYFTYYLNPNENDRNIEFDPNKNLFLYKDGSFALPWKYPSNHPIALDFKERWYGEFGSFKP